MRSQSSSVSHLELPYRNPTTAWLKPGVPNPRAEDHYRLGTSRRSAPGGRVSEASSAAPHSSHYRLNHAPAPRSVEKLSPTKRVPGAEKFGDCWLKQQKFISSQFWRLEVQDQGVGRFGFSWGLCHWLHCLENSEEKPQGSQSGYHQVHILKLSHLIHKRTLMTASAKWLHIWFYIQFWKASFFCHFRSLELKP